MDEFSAFFDSLDEEDQKKVEAILGAIIEMKLIGKLDDMKKVCRKMGGILAMDEGYPNLDLVWGYEKRPNI